MDTIIDTKPLPAPTTLAGKILSLQPGQSLLAPGTSLDVLKATASRIRRADRGRVFKVARADDGPRIWRIQ